MNATTDIVQKLWNLCHVLRDDGITYPAIRYRADLPAISHSIIRFIRQAALGDVLVPYSDRVDKAMKKILASSTWTAPQRKWLERIGQQLKTEVIVDREAFERGQFKAQGGFERINKAFDGRLEEILVEINESLWQNVG